MSARAAKFLGYGRQNIDRSDVDAVVSVLGSDFLTQGPAIPRFEAALAEQVGAKFAVAVSSGGAALHLACLAAELGPGDLGLTAAITFVASANCLRYVGADVAFVDIDAERLGFASASLAMTLKQSPEATALIPVHLGGLAHDAAELRRAAGNRIVIEDAAHALGAAYECGKPVGCCAYGDMAIFSFHPVKSITTGEGGAVVTNNPDLAQRLRMLRSYGIERDEDDTRPWLYRMTRLGFNYRMTDIQAALGLSQLAKLEKFLQRRREIARAYDEVFSSLPHMRLPQSAPRERARSALHLYVAVFDFAALGTERGTVMNELRKRGIGSQVHYIPVYHHPYYAERYSADRRLFAEAEAYYRGCLSLPLHPGLTDEDVERVIAGVKQVIGAA